jgi:predicted dithiol-disulfide oxidoreductase (DUF899 family)
MTRSKNRRATGQTRGTALGTVVAAALALPGVWQPAHAENAPESGMVGFKTLHYQDWQPGLQRIHVNSPSVYWLAPLPSQWAVEGSAVVDNLSGATPRWHTAVSSASVMHESRRAADVKVTRYRERSAWSMSFSRSNEHDYVSNAVSAEASLASEDNNTTWNVGLGASSDTINPVNQIVVDEHKRTREAMLGVTQAWSAADLVQVNAAYTRGEGYYNDPYKQLDQRPRARDETAVLLRWNHYVDPLGATLRTSYRWYHDSFRINAHTLQAEWVQPVSGGIALTPLLRLYSQSSAYFYFDPVYDATLGAPYPAGYDVNHPPQYLSADQRLSAFGAVTVGLKAEWAIDPVWSTDASVARYEQRGNWRLGGRGSPGLAPFNASFVQVGLNRKF